MKMGVLRRNKQGISVVSISAILIVIIVLVVGVIVIAMATDPARPMNHCQQPVAYARATLTWEVGAFLGNQKGHFNSVSVNVMQSPDDESRSDLGAGFLGFAESHGKVYVLTTVQGNGINVGKWKSEETKVDFSTLDLATNAIRTGSAISGLACFDQPGDTTWTFDLIWEDSEGKESLDVRQETVSV